MAERISTHHGGLNEAFDPEWVIEALGNATQAAERLTEEDLIKAIEAGSWNLKLDDPTGNIRRIQLSLGYEVEQNREPDKRREI